MKLYCLFIIIFLLNLATNITAKPLGDLSNKYDFKISIEQNNKEVLITNGVCRLKKQPFTIVIKLSEPNGVLVNASFQNTSFIKASEKRPLEEIPGFSETGLADKKGNEDKDVMLAFDGPNYWYYSNTTDHRFDEIKQENSWWVCKRQITNFYDIKTEKRTPVSKVIKDLYLVFLSSEYDFDLEKHIEIKRDFLQILWLD